MSWRMGKQYNFAIGDIVYLFMSDERRVRFKMVVTENNCKRGDSNYWPNGAPNDITFKLEFLDEYEGHLLDEVNLIKNGFKGGTEYRNSKL